VFVVRVLYVFGLVICVVEGLSDVLYDVGGWGECVF